MLMPCNRHAGRVLVVFFEEPTKKGLTESYGEPSLGQCFAW